jgi:hypothetical protein
MMLGKLASLWESKWERSGGCYAVDLSARGFRERIVFDVLTRQE